MSFIPGYGIRVLANKSVVSGFVAGATMTHNRAVSEVTTAGQVVATAGAAFVPGLMGGTLALRGPQDGLGASLLHTEILAAVGADNGLLITVLPDTDAIGKPALFCMGDPTDWAIDAGVADAVGYTVAAQPDESVELGYVIHPVTAETATGNSASIDRGVGSASARGGAFGLHVTAYAGITNAVVKVQHSADNVSWADLITYATTTVVGWQMMRVPVGTNINRYLRATITVTGAGSITYLVTAAPR